MGARFAGSHRLGDRRRRRLAVESDEGLSRSTGGGALPAPEGRTRVVEPPHADLAIPTTALCLPVTALIPGEWWKYLIGGLACLAVGGSLLTAGWFSPQLIDAAGPGIERLFAFREALAARWFSSLLLLLSAQLAVCIWWRRSQSERDFEGHYWLWIRAACVWLFLSACVSTSVHQTLREIVLHFRPALPGELAILGWLIPAGAVSIWVGVPLSREMRGCRESRALLFAAGGWYIVGSGLCFDVEGVVPELLRPLILQGCLLAGNVSLFVSMWLHARHVMHSTLDPAIIRKSNWRIPRPHFLISRLWSPRPVAREQSSAKPQNGSSSTKRPRKKLAVAAGMELNSITGREAEPLKPEPVREVAPDTPKTKALSPGKPRFRLDARHENLLGTVDLATEVQAGVASDLPANTGVSNERPAAAPTQDVEPVELAALANNADETAQSHETDPDSAGNESDDESPNPDLRGLSKKQRRRLMQELRDRQRSSGR